MDNGILYVVFNKWINNPETHDIPYKIGITKGSVDERYYGLGLKMPGKFETVFAYELDNYTKAEQLIHGIFDRYRENGEWFNINEKELDLIKANCEAMGGKLVTEDVITEIESETEDGPKNELPLLFAKTLREYEHLGISIIYSIKYYVTWKTKNMDEIFPPGHENIGINGIGKNGRKYEYLFDVRHKSLYLELCPMEKDEKTIEEMNKITILDKKNKVSSIDKYRRTIKQKLNINTEMSDEDKIYQFKKGIDSLLDWEKKYIETLK